MQKAGLGARLTLLNLGDDGREFAKTQIVITAVPQKIGGVLHGDGRADVDAIDATGVRLRSVIVPGTLGHIDAGDGRVAIKALTVGALGSLTTQTLLESHLIGALPALSVRGDITAAKLIAGSIAKATIGGSIKSGGVDGAGLFAGTNLGTIVVKGSLLGDAQHRVNIAAQGIVHPTAKTATALASLAIGGSAEFARIAVGGDFHANAGIGTVTISGLFRASDIVAGAVPGAGGYFGDANDHSPPGGSVLPLSRIANIQMRGGIAGTVESGDSFGLVAQTIARLIVGGSAFRPTGNLSLAATGDVRVQLLGIG